MRFARALVGSALAASLAVPVAAQSPLPPVSMPKPRSFVEMGYPAPALESQTQGTAVVRAALDETGHVTSAEALAGPPALAPAAVENVRAWTFEPGPRSAVIVYRFEIDYGRCNDDTRGLFRVKHDNMVVLTTCKGPNRQLGVYSATEPWIREMGDAVYPPIAVSARVTGAVILALDLDRGGKVTKVTPLSGPPLVLSAAVTHARTWRLFSYRKLPRETVMVYEFGLDSLYCPGDAYRAAFRQTDAGHVRLDACPPLINVSTALPKP